MLLFGIAFIWEIILCDNHILDMIVRKDATITHIKLMSINY